MNRLLFHFSWLTIVSVLLLMFYATSGSRLSAQPSDTRSAEPDEVFHIEFTVAVRRGEETKDASVVHTCHLYPSTASDFEQRFSSGSPGGPNVSCTMEAPAVSVFSDQSLSLFEFRYHPVFLYRAFQATLSQRNRHAIAAKPGELVWLDMPDYIAPHRHILERVLLFEFTQLDTSLYIQSWFSSPNASCSSVSPLIQDKSPISFERISARLFTSDPPGWARIVDSHAFRSCDTRAVFIPRIDQFVNY